MTDATGNAEETEKDQSEDRPRIKRRRLSQEERQRLDETAKPGALYTETGWRKKSRDPLRRIQRAVDELDAPGSGRAVARKRRASKQATPAGLRSRITEAIGSVSYVQLSYSTKEHHVCHVGIRHADGIEDAIVLVGPEEVRRFEDVSAAIDQLTGGSDATPETRAGKAGSDLAMREAAGPFGRVYELEKVEGLGEVYVGQLTELGVTDTQALWRADAEALAKALDVSPKRTRRWRQMAELMAVSGIGPQYAELLVRSGVTSIEDLAERDADALAETINTKQEDLLVRIQGNVIKPGRVQGWIDAASSHAPDEGA